jgi:predicted nucleic acid-binding protein
VPETFQIPIRTVRELEAAMLDRLLALLAAHFGAGRQVPDTNIVATMLEHGIYRLLTFNAADFRRFAGTIEIEPPE